LLTKSPPKSGHTAIFDRINCTISHCQELNLEWGKGISNLDMIISFDLTELEFSTLTVGSLRSHSEERLWFKGNAGNWLKKILLPPSAIFQREKERIHVGYATDIDDFQFVRYSRGSIWRPVKLSLPTNPASDFSFALEPTFRLLYLSNSTGKGLIIITVIGLRVSSTTGAKSDPTVPLIKGGDFTKRSSFNHFEPCSKKPWLFNFEYREMGKKEAPWKMVTKSKALEGFCC